jgi:hypothetical protein
MHPESPGGRDRLQSYIQTFDTAMAPDFCAQMVANFERMAHLHVGKNREFRDNLDQSAWTELNISPLMDDAFQGFFVDQIQRHLALYNRRLGLTIDVPMRPRMESVRIKRYRAGTGEHFQPHFDSIDTSTNRYLVFLWYLNDVTEGGETVFCDLDVSVSARAGRLLMFPPYWMFQHAGQPPVSNDKYIVSTYLLF